MPLENTLWQTTRNHHDKYKFRIISLERSSEKILANLLVYRRAERYKNKVIIECIAEYVTKNMIEYVHTA